MGSNKKTIVFVCMGNIHRSALAEQIFKELLKEKGLSDQFEVVSRGIKGSAGTQPTTHKNITKYEEWKASRPSLEELNIDITKHEAKSIDEDIAGKADVIIAFDRVILESDPASLLKQFPRFHGKIHLLSELEGKMDDIPDCKGKEDPEFHRVVTKRIHDILTNYWEELISWTN
jgi:protein-tyrosine phosphatase